ncbi:MAG: AmmeMemoRadiSam system protein B [Desulfurococcales archaeon]|nr:AmmeMemoRadiSam system protein B [Desulfurococcales archaeon]
MKKRLPAHAGTFYPANREELVEALEASFNHPLGPGRLPREATRKRDGERVLGYLVPHAGYMYSGPVAAHAYLDMAVSIPERPDAVVIVGPNHTMLGLRASVYKEGYWETPLGLAEVDSELAKLIVAGSRFFAFDETAHMYEHSVEVQVPFLQYIYGEDVRIVPIVIGLQTLEVARDLANAVNKVISEHGARILYVATTDFNHYESHEITVEKDRRALEKILELDAEALYDVVEKVPVTMCGPAPAASLIYLAREVGAPKPILLKHATSGDVTGEKGWTVGYASIKFPARG